jgi:hypothetical protein
MLRLKQLVLMLVFGLMSATVLQAQDNCTPQRFASQWTMTNFCNTSINFDDIIAGGPPKDGIPAITNPVMETVEEASSWLGERAPVIMVEVNGEARAYPHALLMWHEIANDTIGDIPIAVTFCPLCNSSIVFDRRVQDTTLEFGVSGLLRNSDMVMYDRQTESWWQQFTGEGIVGEYNEVLLDILPSRVIGFLQFAERYPDGLVMSRETGFDRQYGINPYVGYDQTEDPFLFSGELDTRLSATQHVLAGTLNDIDMAYPFTILSEQHIINDTIGDSSVVVFWQPGVASSLERSIIDNSRDMGTATLYSRQLEDGQVLEFVWNADTQTITDAQTGSVWNLFGEAIEGKLVGTTLQQQRFAPHFWFAWVAFHPETLIYGDN